MCCRCGAAMPNTAVTKWHLLIASAVGRPRPCRACRKGSGQFELEHTQRLFERLATARTCKCGRSCPFGTALPPYSDLGRSRRACFAEPTARVFFGLPGGIWPIHLLRRDAQGDHTALGVASSRQSRGSASPDAWCASADFEMYRCVILSTSTPPARRLRSPALPSKPSPAPAAFSSAQRLP